MIIFLKNLYFSPKDFFSEKYLYEKKFILMGTLFIVGASKVYEKIFILMNKNIGIIQEGPIYNLANSWTSFWEKILFVGPFWGFLIWIVGGWWFNLRIKLCDGKDFDNKSGRILYIYCTLIQALPLFVGILMEFLIFKNYEKAYISNFLTPIILLIFPLWSILNSYRSVSYIFKTNRKKSKWWFLAGPLLVYGPGIFLYYLNK